jgi:hypothetical protein
MRFRLGRWLRPRTTCLRRASQAWVLVSICWIARAAALVLILGAFGILALHFLCAGATAAAPPIGPAGATTQIGGGAAALLASGVRASQALVSPSSSRPSASCFEPRSFSLPLPTGSGS